MLRCLLSRGRAAVKTNSASFWRLIGPATKTEPPRTTRCPESRPLDTNFPPVSSARYRFERYPWRLLRACKLPEHFRTPWENNEKNRRALTQRVDPMIFVRFFSGVFGVCSRSLQAIGKRQEFGTHQMPGHRNRGKGLISRNCPLWPLSVSEEKDLRLGWSGAASGCPSAAERCSALLQESSSPGLGSVSREDSDSKTFEMVSAGLHWSFNMSRQMEPFALMLGW